MICLYIFSPSNPGSLFLSAPYFSGCHRMEDPSNMRNSTKSIDEKHPSEDSVTPNLQVSPTWSTSAANVTRKFSEKLREWGVEERGARPIVIYEHGQT